MSEDFFLRPPIKYQPISVPALVSGADVPGNDSDTVTEAGKTFLLTVVNLLQRSVSLFGNKETITFDDSSWPGIDQDATEDKFQFVRYVGGSEDEKVDWGELSRFDIDFDGKTDKGSEIDEALTYQLYSTKTAAFADPSGADSVDYQGVWDTAKAKFSSKNSFWQTLEDKSYPTDDESCFAFLVGLAQVKRSWIYGMTNGLGINPDDPNSKDALANFKAVMNSKLYSESGTINDTILLSYIYLRQSVAERYNKIAGDSFVKGSCLTAANSYYSGRISGISLSSFNNSCGSLDAAIKGLNALLDKNSGKLKNYDAQKKASAESYLSTLKGLLNNLPTDASSLNSKFGLVTGQVNISSEDLNNSVDEGVTAVPATIDANTCFSSFLTKLESVLSCAESLKTVYAWMKSNPEKVVGCLFSEIYNNPLSTESLSDDLISEISSVVKNGLKKPVGYAISISNVNSSFKTTNRINEERYKEKKEESYLNQIEDKKAEGKYVQRRKAEAKEAQMESAKKSVALKSAGEKRESSKAVKSKKRG